MTRYTLSDQADADLEEIWEYIADDNISAADRHSDRLIRAFQTLANQPGMGRIYQDISATLRGFPVGNYLIFYRTTTDGIEIVRVLHGSRDIDTEFDDPEQFRRR